MVSQALDINAPLSTSPVNSGLLPIHIAAIHDQPECIRLLIAAGADPNLQAVVREVNSITGMRCSLLRCPDHLGSALGRIEYNIATRRSGRTALLYMAARGSVQGSPRSYRWRNLDVVDRAPRRCCAHPTRPCAPPSS